jgi:hypothetical protein
VSAEIGYEKRLAQQLVYQNMMLRREADAAGARSHRCVTSAYLTRHCQPSCKAGAQRSESDQDRVERKNIVALLQVNSTALARALVSLRSTGPYKVMQPSGDEVSTETR